MHFYNSQDNGDRFLMVPKSDGFEEIKLSGQAADGLMKLNKKTLRPPTGFAFLERDDNWLLHGEKNKGIQGV